MRLSVSRSKTSTSLYVIESTYQNGKHSSKVVERLGTVEALTKTLGGGDPIEWAKAYIGELNAQAKEGNRKITAEFWANKQLPQNVQTLFNGGYLFLQSIYHGLGLDEICRQISERYRFQYDLSAILSRLIYTRVMYPSSKMSSLEASRTLIEQPEFELAHIYRALDVIAKESDFIQERVYKNSLHLMDRNTAVLYYDCTNYFFETEEEDELRRYGTSKEHRPNPIVQMGLFMDGSGIPLAMCINNGASNEQPTLKPIEDRIARDFSLSKFVVCTDAGLGSRDNRVMNNADGRAFVVTQSLKQMKDFLKAWALTPTGWHIPGSKVTYNLKEIDDTAANECTYYKERWMKENGLVQRLIVSYSPKYKAYQRAVRAKQIVRAERMVAAPGILKRKKQNDPSRFVTTEHCTKEGEIAKRCKVTLDQAAVAKEEMYDGFYGVCTNLEDDISTIIKVNKGRWEIEESFRILKSEFRARPVYLSDTDRIKAHFTTCFLSLLVYRILERKLGQKYTVENILQTLREMKFYELKDAGYIPAYPRTALTDALHDAFGFRTDTEIVLKKEMRGILKTTKAG